jgi:hypothetical protein
MQNPGLFTSDHYRQAAVAVLTGLAIRLLVAIPIIVVRGVLRVISFVSKSHDPSNSWGNEVEEGLVFIENSVLQTSFFLMSLMRYISPTLDQLFMSSLEFVDSTYRQKHKSDDPSQLRPLYHENLRKYSIHGDTSTRKSPRQAMLNFLIRYGRRTGISLAVYLLSFLPIVGRFVLPAASFYTFKEAVGTQPAIAIFGGGLLLPRRYLVVFLQSYFSSRSLMRELLEPYFSRVRFDKAQKRMWFRDREGVLFGFAIGFFVFLKIPVVGVLIYGIAEASTAYLLTKITDPPPPPADAEKYIQEQVHWRNKHEFLSLSLANLDAQNLRSHSRETTAKQDVEAPRKKFT